jgi:sugar lactone lactonase YvrE
VGSDREEVFYPSAPDKPRLQFLTSISKAGDLGAKPAEKMSGLERFIVGHEEEAPEDWIGKPYGMAVYDGRIYVCDVQKRAVEILDLKTKTFEYLTKERRMTNPVNICIDTGTKYVADPTAGRIFVFGRNDELQDVLGGQLDIKPVDVAVRDGRCYVSDMKSNQVVVLDIGTGKEAMRMGVPGGGDGQFTLIADIALDRDGFVYVTDKALGRITKFDRDGVFQQTIGQLGRSIHDFVRPKGLDVDEEGRIWVIDAAPEVGKIYNSDGQLLMFFGFPGTGPGNMNMPASVTLDYDNVELLRDYFTEGAQIDFLVLVSSQYVHKINIYGFGSFPVQEKAIARAREELMATAQADPVQPVTIAEVPKKQVEVPKKQPDVSSKQVVKRQEQAAGRMDRIVEIYRRSMAQYKAGQLRQARAGFVEVMDSGLIPPPMVETLRGYVENIDKAEGGSR